METELVKINYKVRKAKDEVNFLENGWIVDSLKRHEYGTGADEDCS